MTDRVAAGPRVLARRAHVVDIDHLRGIAIVLTLAAHLNAAVVEPIPWMGVVYANAEFWGGVYLFFVISGYVITRGFWDDCADRSRRFSGVAPAFYGRRFFRILPPAGFWIGCTAFCAATLNPGGALGDLRRNLIQALAAATFTYNFVFPLWTSAFGIYWSLTFEEQFYLLFPFLARLDRRICIPLLVLPIVALAFVRRPAGTFLVFVPVDALCWGVLLGLAERAGLLARLEPRVLRRPLARAASLAASLLALVLIPSWLKPLPSATSLMTLVCAWLVFCASFDRGYARLGEAAWLRRLGRVSFSLYLCHTLAFLLARGTGLLVRDRCALDGAWSNAGSVMLGLALTAAFTMFSYRIVEEPARRRGRRVAVAGRACLDAPDFDRAPLRGTGEPRPAASPGVRERRGPVPRV